METEPITMRYPLNIYSMLQALCPMLKTTRDLRLTPNGKGISYAYLPTMRITRYFPNDRI